jgi:large subunit ribosomal protein L19e
MKTLKSQKRMAAYILKVGINKVYFDPDRLQDIKEAVTKQDIESLIQDKAIKKKPVIGNKKRAHNKKLERKKRGRRKKTGKVRKLNENRKEDYMARIRKIRRYLKAVKNRIGKEEYARIKRLLRGGQIKNIKELKIKIGK